MAIGIDFITGIISAIAYDGIKRPIKALTDAHSRRKAFASHKDKSDTSANKILLQKAQDDLVKYIAHSNGHYTQETATFLHELGKTSIPDNIKILVASGRSPEPVYSDFHRVYELFSNLPFESKSFFDLMCTAINLRFRESVDSQVILEAINGQSLEIISRLDAIGSTSERHKSYNYTYEEFSDDRLKVAKYIELTNKHLTVETNSGAKKFPLSRMVVPARLTEISDPSDIPLPHRENSRQQVTGTNVISFRRSFYNAVILGDPGGGKTTLTQHICHALSQQIVLEAANPLDGHFDIRDLKLPLRIVLRRFEARVKSDPKYNLLDYLKDDLRSQFFNSDERALCFVNQLLKTGQAVIIFDGLDEILDISMRREIVTMVENFTHQSPACPCLVTSRIVGYADAPMASEFKMFTLVFHT
ncbi:NACHT domain-containing protein [Paracoccus liaowanqingii]|uniref:NACHT domain-containing protein n=1 Tax=Paracoccus liaowanqingii TaxID=2560053 RepID=A0A4Z1BRM4_9RHOB|nr:NACHT domain-containing protein [Paracoccus liaowanqingii]TGN49408.1 NACHT domain-containing protein [Paracoccus liaowanqingii]